MDTHQDTNAYIHLPMGVSLGDDFKCLRIPMETNQDTNACIAYLRGSFQKVCAHTDLIIILLKGVDAPPWRENSRIFTGGAGEMAARTTPKTVKSEL